jgi:hypothetical protein
VADAPELGASIEIEMGATPGVAIGLKNLGEWGKYDAEHANLNLTKQGEDD